MSFIDVFGGSIVDPAQVSYRTIDLSLGDIALAWPLPGEDPTGLEVAARIMDILTGTGNIAMPPANQTSKGMDALFNNVGAGTASVTDADGNPLATVGPGDTVYLYLIDNATVAGSWRAFTFGTGTSAADAAALAGRGLLVDTGDLIWGPDTVSLSVSPQTFGDGGLDSSVIYRWTGGSMAATLGSAAASGDGFIFGFRNDGSGSALFTPTGGDTVNGQSSITLIPGDSAFFSSNGVTGWFTVGLGRGVIFSYSTTIVDITAGGVINLSNVVAQNKIITLVGVPASATSVNVPAIPSVYNIRNQATGSQQVFVGVTGIVNFSVLIPPFTNVIIVCDGTNVYNFSSTAGTTSSFEAGSAAAPSINFQPEPTTGLYWPGAMSVGIALGGIDSARFTAAGLTIGENQTSGATAQLKMAVALLSPLAGATATATNLIQAGWLVLGVTTRVTTTITGATTFKIGDGTDDDKWGAAIALPSGTTTRGSDFTVLTPSFYTANTSVVLTANGANFTGGAVRVVVTYIDLTAPTL